jgi:hypothetical protein
MKHTADNRLLRPAGTSAFFGCARDRHRMAETPEKKARGETPSLFSLDGSRVEPGGPERAGRKGTNLAVFLGGTSALWGAVDGLRLSGTDEYGKRELDSRPA